MMSFYDLFCSDGIREHQLVTCALEIIISSSIASLLFPSSLSLFLPFSFSRISHLLQPVLYRSVISYHLPSFLPPPLTFLFPSLPRVPSVDRPDEDSEYITDHEGEGKVEAREVVEEEEVEEEEEENE